MRGFGGLAALVSAVLLLFGGCSDAGQTEAPMEITAFSFSHRGMSTGDCYLYQVSRESDGVRLYTEQLFAGGEIVDVRIDDPVLEQLNEIAEKYALRKWDGFDKTDSSILDGTGFTLSITLADGSAVSAKGSNQFPEGYSEAKEEICALFEGLIGQYRQPEPPEDEEPAFHAVTDGTGLLWSEELDRLSREVLPALTETYGIDLRVDLLTDLSGYADLASAAEGIYRERGYGSDGGNGVTLTLLLNVEGDGVSLLESLPYAAGDSWELTTSATWNVCRNYDLWLAPELWSGNLEHDRVLLAGAVNDMATGIESFVLAGGVHSTIWSPVTGSRVVPEDNVDAVGR
ncbi:MAG: hypothetical protein IJF59_00970 [Clostridia bacterium]|nr:hypothetical protein [Clostridia bacterium]